MGRTEKSIKNIAFGLVAQFVTTLMAFITRTVMLSKLGIDSVSLNGLFTEVVSALSLAEMGIGGAIIYNLYKPLAEGDQEMVCRLMTFFKTVYRMIAAVTFGLGVVVCIFAPLMVKDIVVADSYVRLIFMLFVVQISSSYLFTYKISLVNADQKSYVASLVQTGMKIVGSLLLLGILYLTENYIFYLIGNITVTVATNMICSIVVDRQYPYLKDLPLQSDIRKQIFSNVKNIFVKQLSGKITNSTDNILISTMVSTVLVGYYSFYALVIGVFKQVVEQIATGISASMGNLFISGTNEECERLLNRLTWMYGVMATFCCCCIYVCMEPFLCLWVGEEYLLANSVLVILVWNLYVYMVCKPVYTAVHVAGFFVEGRNISIAGSVVNLIVSVIIGLYIGIEGIFIGTLCTYVIQIVAKIWVIYRKKFHKSMRMHFISWGISCLLLGVLMIACRGICNLLPIENLWIRFFANGIVAAGLSSFSMLLLFHKREEFSYALGIVKKVVGRKKR